MRIPRARITVRRLMIAVAVLGILLWSTIVPLVRRRSERFAGRAYFCRMTARQLRQAYKDYPNEPFGYRHGPEFAATPSLKLVWAKYFDGLAAKYERAAERPWLPVAPDPPYPEPLRYYGGY